MDHRHRRLALAQIAGDGLTQHVFGRGQIEHIIDNLKRHAQVVSVAAQSRFLLGGSAAQNCSQSHTYRKQASSLAEDEIEVLVERYEVAQLFHLQQFALDHLLGKFDEGVENSEVSLLHRDLEGLHVKPVAGQHALRISPLRIGGRTSTPGLGLVNNVVMYQRRRMDNLDNGTQPDCTLALIVEQFRRKQQQRRSDSLAAASTQVFANLGDRLHARERVAAELAFQRGEVVPQQIEYFFSVDGGRCAQFSALCPLRLRFLI